MGRNAKQNVISKNIIGMTLIPVLYGVRVHAIFRCKIIHKMLQYLGTGGGSVWYNEMDKVILYYMFKT